LEPSLINLIKTESFTASDAMLVQRFGVQIRDHIMITGIDKESMGRAHKMARPLINI